MVIIGFGEFNGYKLQEVSNDFLNQLTQWYSLSHSSHENSSVTALRATIAIHEEVQRRANGGAICEKQMSRKELAIKIVNSGFRHMSKDHHPDMPSGNAETQKKLSAMRDYLLEKCSEIAEPKIDGAFYIPDPNFSDVTEITDDDIPF